MATIYRTTEVNGHWHAVYLNQAQNVFLTTVDGENPHDHQVVLNQDPETGQTISIIGENDNHTHDLMETKEVLPAKPKKEDEKKTSEAVISLFKSAEANEKKSRDRGIESAKFFKGDQWQKEVKQKLESENRAAQTLNVVASSIDILSGIARQNKLDPRAFPVEGSDEGVADIATALLMRISKMSKMPTEEIRVFEDGLIPGRGLFNVGITQKRNPRGEIFAERFPWKDGYFGRHEKLDASDATHSHKAKWMSLGEALGRFPKKKDELTTMVNFSLDNAETTDMSSDRWEVTAESNQYYGDTSLVDKTHKRVRLIEHEVKEFRTAFVAIDDQLELEQEVSEAIANKLITLPIIQVLELVKERMVITITAGTSVVKAPYYPDRPYEGFSLTPYYVYKYDDNDGFNGKVEFMKDPQREINKRSSQIIDAANRTLAPGWDYTSDTFDDPKDERNFKQNVGKTGSMTKHSPDALPPQPRQAPKFPSELITLQRENISVIGAVTNINASMAGQSSEYQSGQAGMQQRQAGLVGNERVFDNFILSKQVVMQKVFKLAQKYMSKERIARIVLSEASNPERMEELQIANQPIPQQRSQEEDALAMQNILRILETKDLSEYDISIGEQPLSPTMKEFERKSWQDAQAQGIPVPPGLLVELSSLPNKGKWAKAMEALQQEKMEMEKLKFETEMQKAGRMPGQNNNPGGSQ